MAILLDHLIVPARDREAGAAFLAKLLDRPTADAFGFFSAVYVSDTLTIDFANVEPGTSIDPHHYCFHVRDEEFDAIHRRIVGQGLAYQSSPHGPVDNKISTANGGKNLYWSDTDGHCWEILTVSYARPAAGVVV